MRVRAGALVVLLAACECEPSPAPEPTVSAPVAKPDEPRESAPAPDPCLGDEPLVPNPGTAVLALEVRRMRCEGCARTVAGALAGLLGVVRVRVSFAHHRAWVEHEAARAPEQAALDAAVRREGFAVAPLEAGPGSGSR